MLRRVLTVLAVGCCLHTGAVAQGMLKSLVYDFEGTDIGQVDLPEGDYKYGDLSYKITDNPLGYSGMLGNRSLQVDIAWSTGYGAFGKGITRFIELDPASDMFNFYFYNPVSNSSDATVSLILSDDDNDNSVEDAGDDRWSLSVTLPRSAGWKLCSFPLSSFKDVNTGGNGIFDISYSGNGGKLLKVEFRFSRTSPSDASARYWMDMICFSRGSLPTGTAVQDLPPKLPGDYCRLGAYGASSQSSPQLVPNEFEGLFPAMPGRRIRYVNTFMAFSNQGTTPDNYPGASIQALLDRGYRPIITWEPFYSKLAPLDPAQPRLADIIGGKFDAYIDAFGDRLKAFTDTVIVRPMHEFDGNWYPWCISTNTKNPAEFAAAFRHFVDRCRARGASKVKWMWCPNASPAPNAVYNWSVNAWPGDAYVDIVATNVYNHPFLGTPYWRTFRQLATECYYYLRTYFPQKPFFICETSCRERDASEDPTSQDKPYWIGEMDKEVQSEFHEIRALIWFNYNKEHDWRVNSSSSAQSSYSSNIWMDDYYFPGITTGIARKQSIEARLYPNPASDRCMLSVPGGFERAELYNTLGEKVATIQGTGEELQLIDFTQHARGMYLLRVKTRAGIAEEKLLLE